MQRTGCFPVSKPHARCKWNTTWAGTCSGGPKTYTCPATTGTTSKVLCSQGASHRGSLVHTSLTTHLASLSNLHSWSSQNSSSLTSRYWLEDDGTMCLDDSHRWKSAETIAWLRVRDLHSVPNSIKADIGDLVYNGPSRNVRDESAAPSSIQRSTTWTMNLLPMSRRLNREYEPMSRRLNRECPCEAKGYITSGSTSNLPQVLWQDILRNGQWPKWPHRLLW